MKTVYLGSIYFNENETLRILNDKNPNKIKCMVNYTLKRKYLTLDELQNNYTRLTPHGIAYFNIVKIGDIEDVMIMVYRKKDIDNSEQLPYIICRQNITDIFANTIVKNYNNLETGCCVSKKSLPEKVNMENLLACDGIISSEAVCFYIDDTVEKILSFIKIKPYDTVLYNLYIKHIQYKYKDNIKEMMKYDIVDGYCKSLNLLLIDNEFKYELNSSYDIYTTDIYFTDNDLINPLNNNILSQLSYIISKNILYGEIYKYSKDIDLDKITSEYILIKDIKQYLYIIIYKWNEYQPIKIDSIESIENIEKLSKIYGYSKYINKTKNNYIL